MGEKYFAKLLSVLKLNLVSTLVGGARGPEKKCFYLKMIQLPTKYGIRIINRRYQIFQPHQGFLLNINCETRVHHFHLLTLNSIKPRNPTYKGDVCCSINKTCILAALFYFPSFGRTGLNRANAAKAFYCIWLLGDCKLISFHGRA